MSGETVSNPDVSQLYVSDRSIGWGNVDTEFTYAFILSKTKSTESS